METEVDIEEINRFPLGDSRWEVNKTVRRVKYEIRQILPNEIFGHQELIQQLLQEKNHDEKADEVVRDCRIIASTGCEVIYLNKEYFARYFDEPDRAYVLDSHFQFDEEDVKQKIGKLL